MDFILAVKLFIFCICYNLILSYYSVICHGFFYLQLMYCLAFSIAQQLQRNFVTAYYSEICYPCYPQEIPKLSLFLLNFFPTFCTLACIQVQRTQNHFEWTFKICSHFSLLILYMLLSYKYWTFWWDWCYHLSSYQQTSWVIKDISFPVSSL